MAISLRRGARQGKEIKEARYSKSFLKRAKCRELLNWFDLALRKVMEEKDRMMEYGITMINLIFHITYLIILRSELTWWDQLVYWTCIT